MAYRDNSSWGDNTNGYDGERWQINDWDFDYYYLTIAFAVAEAGTCINNTLCGSVIVSKDNRIVSTGYNGVNDIELEDKYECDKVCNENQYNDWNHKKFCKGEHAEINAMSNANKNGLSLDGCTIYSTHQPCTMCGRMIGVSGIKKVVYLWTRPTQWKGMDKLEKRGIDIVQYDINKFSHEIQKGK